MARTGLGSRLSYLRWRLKALDIPGTWKRAKAIREQHGTATLKNFFGMLWWAAFHDTPFQDYVDWDFAILNKSERLTYLTNAHSYHIARRFNAPEKRDIFKDKILFNRLFDEELRRSWFEVEAHDADELRDYVTAQGTVIAKVPRSNSGYGVARYEAADIDDWSAFRAELIEKGQILLEEFITQHPALAAVSPHIVNTTRVTTFVRDDGEVEILSFAQKFSVGKGASDQQSFGGFFTVLDLDGSSLGPGYGSHQRIYTTHPDTGASIVDFRLPRADEVLDLAKRVSRIVPEIRYVGWDIVLTEDGPVVLEGNWMAGAYENKVSATGVRTGSRERFRAVTGM